MKFETAMQLEQAVTHLFWDVTSELKGRYVSVQFMADDNFVHRRDRTENDIHAFYELADSRHFHLRGYVRHMLQNLDQVNEGQIFLTGYLKEDVTHTGGEHSLLQKWYNWDAKLIADEMVSQNPELFRLRS